MSGIWQPIIANSVPPCLLALVAMLWTFTLKLSRNTDAVKTLSEAMAKHELETHKELVKRVERIEDDLRTRGNPFRHVR